MEPSELKELSEDISQNTQRAPITLYENKILDGRNRYRACLMINFEPKFRHYTGNDPQGFVVSANLKRKHLDESQRSMVAAKLASMKNGRPEKGANLHGFRSKEQAAKDLNVSPRSVATAKTVLREAPKQDIKAVEQGKKTVSAVAKQIKEKKTKSDSPTDKTDRVIPDEILADWQRAEQVGKKLVSLAREIKSIVAQGFSDSKDARVKDFIYAEINNSAISDAESLAWTLSSVIPYAICPTCQGVNRKSCGLCKKRGCISKFLFNSPAVSEDTKKLLGK